MGEDKLHYAFYGGCCFQGADVRFADMLEQVMGRLDAELHVLEEAVCCGSGVIEERSELTSLALRGIAQLTEIQSRAIAQSVGDL